MKLATFHVFLFFFVLGIPQQQVVSISHPPVASTALLPTQKEIMWDATSLIRISSPDSGAFYPRMIQLHNGALLTVYSSNGNVVFSSSCDNGASWTPQKIVAPRRNKVNMDTPELLQLNNGAILICYATRPQAALKGMPDSAQKFEVRIQKSNDNGKTWTHEKVLYQAGSSFKDGCWEPALLQLPSGEIQLFFANEALYTSSNEQNISILQSFDHGDTWSFKPRIICFRNNSRDGMPVPIWLKDERKIVVAIEDPGVKNFKPYTIRSSVNGKWNKIIAGHDADRSYALADHIADSIYAGAPYLRRVSTGETILSYQSTEGRLKNKDHNAVMRVAVGSRSAKYFKNVTTPFIIPEGYNAFWNSLCVLNDDTIIAMTSTNGFSKGRSEVWMIKGILRK